MGVYLHQQMEHWHKKTKGKRRIFIDRVSQIGSGRVYLLNDNTHLIDGVRSREQGIHRMQKNNTNIRHD